ncbi:hypothetical protein ACFLZ8_02940, partial [Planctomycetota bacterium]
QENVSELKNISGITVPLYNAGSSSGIIFLYHAIGKKLTKAETQNILAIACGLTRAISFYQTLMNCS